MQRVAAGTPGDLDQAGAVEVGRRSRPVERHGVVAGPDVQRRRVLLRVDGDAFGPVLGNAAHQADRDLAAVRHEDPGDHRGAATPRYVNVASFGPGR